ncbi:MAG: DUF2510 domain-containing protein [Acidimicrobiia bacterium]|nr:DUF2510 domain-containing protein [Acidimicrobiia bacterium]
MDGWEFAYIQTSTNAMKDLIVRLNDLGCEGWELVSLDDQDRTIGVNAVVATLKRRIVPFDAPAVEGEAWLPDPAGRFDKRFWNGRAWTFHCALEADKSTHRDPPTRLAPYPDMRQ